MRKPAKHNKTRTSLAAGTRRPGRSTFPIVGLGASAGGLEALEQFLKAVPPASGLAFVIVQHLDPEHECIMAELLQRSTPMKVVQVTDRTHVLPDSVYVIPPNKDLSLLHGVLHLLEPSSPRGLRLPIDFFPFTGGRSARAQRGGHSFRHGQRWHDRAEGDQGTSRRGSSAGIGLGEV